MGDSGTGGGGHHLVSVRALIAGLLLLWLAVGAGCASGPRHARTYTAAPPAYHIVQRGDTLYGISFRYNLDYRRVARWNGIRPPYRIYPGQRIRLYPPAGKASPSRSSVKPHTARSRVPAKKKITRTSAKAKPGAGRSTPAKRGVATGAGLSWSWPTEGRILRSFKPDSPGRKGIDIAGRPGQPVRAAAAGRVVYAGSGLRGYGALIIIKHNKNYLSAYAHNRRLLVKEGDRVRKGQKIAELGATGTDRPKLHFEIRRNGRPVDPLKFLPRR